MPLAPSQGETNATVCGKGASVAGVQWGSYVSNTRNNRAPDGEMCAECKVFCAAFRAKVDWNEFIDVGRTSDGTMDIKDVSDKRKGSTMDCPGQVTEEEHMGWNTKRRLWIANTAEFTKLFGTPMRNKLLRAPSYTVPCETGEGFGTVWAFSMGETGLPLREMTLFQQGGASKHKLRMIHGDCCFEARGQLVLQNCHKAHLQRSGQSERGSAHTPGVPRLSVWRCAESGWRPGVGELQLGATRPCHFCRDHRGA